MGGIFFGPVLLIGLAFQDRPVRSGAAVFYAVQAQNHARLQLPWISDLFPVELMDFSPRIFLAEQPLGNQAQ